MQYVTYFVHEKGRGRQIQSPYYDPKFFEIKAWLLLLKLKSELAYDHNIQNYHPGTKQEK